MKWEKTSPDREKLFDSLLPVDPRLEKRKMFGYPCAFTKGNMFCGMHGNNVIVRLPEEKRSALIKKGWVQFEPMPGRVMKEYLLVPEIVLKNKKESQKVIFESLEYTSSLPPKKRK